MATKYLYFIVSPDIFDRHVLTRRGQSICFFKFGITTDPNLNVVRRGYSTHNPSYGYNKIPYDTNISLAVRTEDLGKAMENEFREFKTNAQQIGSTEWYCGQPQKMETLLKVFSEYEDEAVDRYSVELFIERIRNALRRS
ncbi:hypothetical protein [Teredinibacter turnerae]|nr:hypothetical protein [Teredinibacter turnerae]